MDLNEEIFDSVVDAHRCQPYRAPDEKTPTRLMRAAALVRNARVVPNPTGGATWHVTGKSGAYIATPHDCTCTAAQYRHEWCYHRIAAKLYDAYCAATISNYMSQFPQLVHGVPLMPRETGTILDPDPLAPLATEALPPFPIDETDDIPDPPLPLSLMSPEAQARQEQVSRTIAETATMMDAPEPQPAQTPTSVDPNTLAGQVVMAVDDAIAPAIEQATQMLKSIDQSWERAMGALERNNSGLLALTQAVQAWAPHTPYSATVQVVTPSGFPMALTVQALSEEAFMGKVGALMQLLSSSGFQAPGRA